MGNTSPIIRVAAPDDAAAIAAIYAPYVTHSSISFEREPPDAAEMARRIEAVLPTHPWLVCSDGDTVLGYAYAGAHRARAAYRWATETSAYVSDDHHRRGVGRALYGAIIELLIEQRFARAFAGITLPNAASVAFHESLGFEPVGVYARVGFKFDRWHDVGWWQRDLRPAASPAEPVAFARLRPEPAVAEILARAATGLC